MYQNDYMYAIERSDEYLAHYGIKGMKWGVRKAIESGNSKALGRAYKKAARKLAKLEKRGASGKKYAKRAAALGAGAAVAGGLAAAGTGGVANAMRWAGGKGAKAANAAGTVLNKAGSAAMLYGGTRGGNKKLKAIARKAGNVADIAGHNLRTAGQQGRNAAFKGAGAVQMWGNQTAIGGAAANAGRKGLLKAGTALSKSGHGSKQVADSFMKAHKANSRLAGVSNNTIARIGAGAVGAGLAGAAGYNAYRAATAKRNAQKAQQWRSEMNKAFAGTQYANGGGNRSKKRRRR